MGVSWEESLPLEGGECWVTFWLVLVLVYFQFPVGTVCLASETEVGK